MTVRQTQEEPQIHIYPEATPGGPPGGVALTRVGPGQWFLTAPTSSSVTVYAHDSPGRVVLYDNGSAHRKPDERALRFDTEARTVHVDGRRIRLPRLEFDLLAHLAARPHVAFTRDQLIADLWPDSAGTARTIDVHIARLRKRLGEPWRRTIQTVVAVGYRYVPAAGRA